MKPPGSRMTAPPKRAKCILCRKVTKWVSNGRPTLHESCREKVATLTPFIEWITTERPCFNCGDGGDPSEAEDLKHWCGECENSRTEYPLAHEIRERARALVSLEESGGGDTGEAE